MEESKKLNHRIWTSLFDSFEWSDLITEEMELGRSYDEVVDSIMENVIPMYLEDEKDNMDVPLQNRMIAIADMGLWWGRTIGVMKLGANLSYCLSLAGNYDDSTFYCDEEDLRATLYHHDGRHEVVFRTAPADVIEELESLAGCGGLTIEYALSQTESLRDEVKKVYGFE